MSVVVDTEFGKIVLTLHPEAAPETVAHFKNLVGDGLFSNTTFYRSDFVIQFGLHGSNKKNPHPNLKVNESKGEKALKNIKGAVAVAHWDVPDCGNSEFFISLKDNHHLDEAYGGYAVFATVDSNDNESWAVIGKIAAEIPKKKTVKINKIEL